MLKAIHAQESRTSADEKARAITAESAVNNSQAVDFRVLSRRSKFSILQESGLVALDSLQIHFAVHCGHEA
jgi:hypothetical protein